MNDTAALLDLLASYYARYVVLTPDQQTALALWTLHTHVFNSFSTTPYLVVTSAEPRSGKSRLIECLSPMVPNPQTLVALTEAVLFRVVSKSPTLLIDETDSIFSTSKFGPSEKQEGLRGILNAGYRKGSSVGRCAPGSNEVENWPVYGPKVLAGIGHLPITIEDRGLCIRLARRLESEPIERFRYETGIEWGVRVMPILEAWGPGARIALAGARPELPEELDDRAQDAYEVLIAIADLAGGGWPTRARDALVALRGEDSSVRESMGVRVFRDVSVLTERLGKMERIATKDLLAWLYEYGEEPYEDWWGESAGKKASRRLALIFEEYGVRPQKYWEDGATVRGYATGEILAAKERYLGPYTPDTPDTPGSASPNGLSDSQHARIWIDPGVSNGDPGVSGNGANPHGDTVPGVSGVSGVSTGSPDFGTASLADLEAWAEGLGNPES